MSAFYCNRLIEKLNTKIIESGRRQFILHGKIDDLFFTNHIKGVCNIDETLLLYALLNDYEIALVFDPVSETLQFPNPEMERLYQTIVNKKSVDPNKDQNSVPRNKKNETTNINDNAAQVANQSTQNAVTKNQSILDEIRYRLIPCQRKSFIVLKNLHKIIKYQQGILIPESERMLTAIGEWAKTETGKNSTCSVILVDDSKYFEFTSLTEQLIGTGLKDRIQEISINNPDTDEIEALLTRILCRYNLTGFPRETAKNIVTKNEAMFNIVEKIKSKISKLPLPQSIDDLFEDNDAADRRKILEEAKRELDELIGLSNVKEKIRKLEARAEAESIRRKNGKKPSSFNTHSLLLGNPGTGKTEVARILSKIYYGLGLRPKKIIGNYVKLSATEIAAAWSNNKDREIMKNKINEAMNGTLFIDEVYSFAEDQTLHPAFDVLMEEMEINRDYFTVLAAGYLEKRPEILGMNPGLPTRFNDPDNTIIFPDYNVNELIQIAEMMLKRDEKILTVTANKKLRQYIESRERLGGIGNARGVRNLIDKIKENAAVNRQHDEIDENSIPDPIQLQEKNARILLNKIHKEFKGLKEVKEYLERLLANQIDNIARNVFDDNAHHLALLGNSGTGKTSIVKYMAEFFNYVGITSLNHVEYCDVNRDFSDSRKLRKKFDQALGGVLFIDEAYRLAETQTGQEALNQIVQIMTEKKYRDLVIIIAGYPDKTQAVFNRNLGLERRFRKRIIFQDFTIDELEQIFMETLKNEGFRINIDDTEQFGVNLRQELKRLSRDPHFGNAGTVKKFLGEVSTRRVQRCNADSKADRTLILADDIKSSVGKSETLDSILDELDKNFVGLQNVKEQIREIASTIAENERLGVQGEGKYNMQFVGNPGTGKTTIARYMARIFNAIGLIDGVNVIERSAITLKGSYLGHSKDNVIKVFEEARTTGGVLFFDEAYALYPKDINGQDSFAAEVISTIVSEDTAQYNERVFSILAGYPNDMNFLLKSNPGLASRYPYIIIFPDYTVEECIKILHSYWQSQKRKADESQADEINKRLREIITKIKSKNNFGNAREIKTLAIKIIANVSKRKTNTITLSDLPDW
ncbi:MAG: AAA family ATPase [Planctomycetaceae bacterium]|jgi:SpoVK/Ycf46/Vps4 family AAA+-type ATPase|nr:AAA family ATPase [Planctomycetaceae bacterium]